MRKFYPKVSKFQKGTGCNFKVMIDCTGRVGCLRSGRSLCITHEFFTTSVFGSRSSHHQRLP